MDNTYIFHGFSTESNSEGPHLPLFTSQPHDYFTTSHSLQKNVVFDFVIYITMRVAAYASELLENLVEIFSRYWRKLISHDHMTV